MVKRVVIILLLIVLVVITGCSVNAEPIETEDEPDIEEQDVVASYDDFYSGNWLGLKHTAGNMKGEYYFLPETWGMFGTLAINNYRTGFNTADLGQNYDTLFIVNRISKVSETLICTTYPEETAAEIPIRRILHDDDVSTVNIKSFEAEKKDTNWIPTDTLTDEELIATDYYADRNAIWVEGFEPEFTRTMITTYMPDTEFVTECVFVDKERNGYAPAPKEIVDWVTFDKDIYIVEPNTYMPVWVYLNVPENVELPDNWEFWVEVSMDSGKTSMGVVNIVTVRVPVQVTMAK